MVIAYHVIFSTYGFWLPNDPRGSNSEIVRAETLHPFGLATKVRHARSVAGKPHDRALRLRAKEALKYNPVKFDGAQARSVGNGFGKAVVPANIVIRACAILPEHVHLVVMRHRYPIETIVRLLKGAATRELIADRLHPFQSIVLRDGSRPTPWGRKYRDVYVSDEASLALKILYVRNNPLKEGKPVQRWSFVQP